MKNIEGLRIGWGWNKGTKGIMKSNSTSFKKGRVATNKKTPPSRQCAGCFIVFYTKPSLARVLCCSKRCAQKKRLRETGHPNWISDRSKLKAKQERGDSAYREWRKNVWLRDDFKCKIANPDCSGQLEAHHILGWTQYPELRYDINNGITLCHAHHPRKRAEEKRLSPYFQSLVSVSK